MVQRGKQYGDDPERLQAFFNDAFAEVHPGGRPTKLTPETAKGILQVAAEGWSDAAAAAAVGLDPQTLRNWQKWGEEEPDGIYGQFFGLLKAARLTVGRQWLRDMRVAMSWQQFAWRLERRFPEEWGLKKDQVGSTVVMNYVRGDTPKDPGKVPPDLLAPDP